MGAISNFLSRLGRNKSGNAALMLGLGMPALIGGAGLSIDLAQWYTWKRELQYAVDQAAVAGAWAKAANETGTDYVDRATQEYNAALSLTTDFDSGVAVSLADYDGGTNNSVLVVASASTELPFTGYMGVEAATIEVSAQAIFEPGATYRPCMFSLDPSAMNAFWINGNVTVTAGCGIGAISDDPSAVIKDGNSGNIQVGFVVTSGGIEDPHGHFNQETTVEGAGNLADPYEGLEPPNDSTPRSLNCATSNNKWTATETVKVTTTYSYWRGKNTNSLTAYNHPSPKATTTTTTVTPEKQFNSEPADSTTAGNATFTQVGGGGNDKIWEKASPVTAKTYSDKVAPASATNTALPGTYTNFNIACDTVLSSGVYVIDGGDLTIQGQNTLSGSGVMIVLKNGAGFRVAGGAKINLTAMTKDQLLALGVSDADASKMVGMLIFEDPDSSGSTTNTLTGNSTQILNGVIYMPNSGIHVAGTPTGVSQCLVIATKTIQISGNVNMTNLCPTNVTPNAAIADTKNVVRLVG